MISASSSLPFRPVTHVIFDLDGLTLDTERVYKSVYENIAAKYGKTYTMDVRLRHVGSPERDTAQIIVGSLGLPIAPEEFTAEANETLEHVLSQASLMPGAERLLRHFYSRGVPFALATSSTNRSYEIKTTNYKELFSLFNHIVTGGSDPEVTNGKPAPDIFLVCASRFPDRPDPSQVLVLEDAINGAQAARSAGMQVVLVPDPIVPQELRVIATHVLNSLEEFHPEMFGLPPF